MARWRQVKDPETGKYHMIPVDEAAARRDYAAGFIVRDFDAFKSPIDGSIIRTQRDYENHCKKHDVIPTAEIDKSHWEQKAKERERLYTGKRTKKEDWERKAEIYELMNHMERTHGN